MTRGITLSLTLLLIASGATRAGAQEIADDAAAVVRVQTRVVFLDAIVKDKRTQAAAEGLQLGDFEVRADGQPRPVAYFSRAGDKGRRPLALTLVFDLERLGAGRYLRRTEILEAMAAELSKLPPEDEVAVVVLDPGGLNGKREWLTGYTRNRAQTAAALAVIPTLVAAGADAGAPEDANTKTAANDAAKTPAGGDGGNHEPPPPSPSPTPTVNTGQPPAKLEDYVKPGDEYEMDEFVDKKGRKVRRIVKADGTVILERKNKDGMIEIDERDAFDLVAAALEINRRVAQERPHAQAALVYVSDGIAPMFYDQRDVVEAKLIRQNVIFSALVTDMKTGFKFAMPILKPLGNWAGLQIAGGAQYLAKQTGGEVARVRRPDDYARALAKIIGTLNARYALGFALTENEIDDGQMHPLEVRVNARDAKGKARKLEVNARKNYFMPPAAKPAAVSQPQDATRQ